MTDNFIAKILLAYQNNFIVYKQITKSFEFAKQNNEIMFYNNGQKIKIWTEWHWYWFAWWKIHFNDAASIWIEEITSQGSDAADMLSESLGSFPGLYALSSSFLKVFSIALLGINAIFYQYNYGNGVWIGVLGLVPLVGWGSR